MVRFGHPTRAQRAIQGAPAAGAVPHVLRNSILPIVTLVGLSFPGVVSGAVIAEEVFNFRGMGLLFFQAATEHDFPVLLGCTLIIGVATVVGNLAADFAYGILDPRIRYGDA